MAKVTVYVADDQLEQLKAVKGFGRGGVSKLFQAFLESVTGGNEPTGRYDYARKLMPLHAAIERHRRRLARGVQAGGPPADGGPVSAALTVLLYRRVIESDPSLAAAFEKEFARFGLDELVASETEGVDLLAEPSEDEEVEEGDEDMFEFLAPFGIRIGDDVRDALKHVAAFKVGGFKDGFKDVAHRERERERAIRRAARRSGGGKVVVEVSSSDDPRDVLTATDFGTFTKRHDDWEEGSKLTPSQMETVRDLLMRRAGADPDTETDDVDTDADADADADVEAAAAEGEGAE